MPRSKRDKKISLTKTAKHGKSWKKDMYEKVREEAEKYSSIYLLRVGGMRIGGLNKIRKQFRDSTLLLGKNKVMGLALGKDQASAVNENTDKLGLRLTGQSGLLFTDEEESEVLSYFDTFVESDFARSGAKATEDVELEAGPLTQFAHSIEPHLRSLGMPTQLKKGVIMLLQDFTVCKKGQVLTPQQASILKLLEIRMANFKVRVDSKWNKPDEFKVFERDDEDDDEENEENDEEATVEDVEMDEDDDEDDEDEDD